MGGVTQGCRYWETRIIAGSSWRFINTAPSLESGRLSAVGLISLSLLVYIF